MPTFKPKTVKKLKVSKRASTTLDGKHREFINQFHKDEHDNIPQLKKRREELRKRLEVEEELVIEEKMNIKDEIEEITNQIKALRNKKTDYYLDNSKYIFEYFENKKNISSGISNEVNSKKKLVNAFFKTILLMVLAVCT